MKRKVLSMTAMLAVSSLFIGCSAATSTKRVDFTPVTVRFVMPPEPDALADASVHSGARLATDGSYDGFADPNDTASPASDVYHVALWGDAFSGHDVTRGVTMLKPGAYTFAFLDRDHGDMMQGWIEVNQERENLIDFLRTWRNQIPQQKRQLAYDYEVRNQVNRGDSVAIEGFQKQLDALDRVEKQLNQMIRSETSARNKWRQQTHHLFENAEFRIFPGGEPVFHPATRAAFNDTDMATVRKGDPVSKFVLLADHEEAQWKLNRVNQLYSELKQCRAVMQEAANRYERQKGLYLLTDHLHPNDSRFVENEIRLQNTLGVAEHLDGQMADLRHRRLALAFVSGLIAPRDHFRALNKEEQDLMRERVVLDTEVGRLDLLIEQADPSQIKRVTLEQNRQRVQATLHNLDQHIEDLWAAHRSLETMITSKSVIHRQGDQRLLAATLVGSGLPFPVRQAVEHEAVMTVRLEKSDSVYLPTEMDSEGSVTRGKQPVPFRPDKVAQRKIRPVEVHYGTPAVAKRTTSAYRGQPAASPRKNVHGHKTSTKGKQVAGQWQPTTTRHKTKVGPKKSTAPRTHKKVAVRQPAGQKKSTARDEARKLAFKKSHTQSKTANLIYKKSKGPRKGYAPAKVRKVARRDAYKGKIRKAHPIRKPRMHKRHVVRSSPRSKTAMQAKVPTTRQPQVLQRRPHVTHRQRQAVQRRPHVTHRQGQVVQRPDRVTPPNRTTTPKRSMHAKRPTNDQRRMTDRRDWVSPPPKPKAKPRAQFVRRPYMPKERVHRVRRVADTTPQKVKKSGCDLPWFIQVFVPPCWFVGSIQPEAKVVSYKDSPVRTKSDNDGGTCELPWFVQVFVPPCWFVDSNQKDTPIASKKQTHHRKTKVASHQQPHYRKANHYDGKRTRHDVKRTRYNSKPEQNKTKGCDLPWFVQVFVPPCWFLGSQQQSDASLADYKEPAWQNRDYNKPVDNKDKKEKNGCELPWLIKVLVPPCWFVD